MTATARGVVAMCIAMALVCVSVRPLTAFAYVKSATVQQDKEDEKKKKKKKEEKKKQEEKGALGTFEAEATKAKPDTSRSDQSGEPGGWFDFFGEMALYATLAGAIGSWYRITGKPVDADLERNWGHRQTGEASIPFVALNLNYQNVQSDVDALDVTVDGGYGPLGAHFRFTRFKEEEPDTELDLSWLHGVLRMSYTKYIEVGLGFGAIFLDGAGSESGSSFTLPIRIDPSWNFGLDARPTWGWINGTTISDHDVAVRLGIRYVSVRAGYRWTKTGNSTLKGPLVGVLLSY